MAPSPFDVVQPLLNLLEHAERRVEGIVSPERLARSPLELAAELAAEPFELLLLALDRGKQEPELSDGLLHLRHRHRSQSHGCASSGKATSVADNRGRWARTGTLAPCCPRGGRRKAHAWQHGGEAVQDILDLLRRAAPHVANAEDLPVEGLLATTEDHRMVFAHGGQQ